MVWALESFPWLLKRNKGEKEIERRIVEKKANARQ